MSRCRQRRKQTYRNKQVRHLSLVLLTTLPILGPTFLHIPPRPVPNHAPKAARIKPWKRAVEPAYPGPAQRKEQITRIMHLPRNPVPSIDQDAIPGLGFDDLWVLQGTPRKLRECVSLDQGAALHGSETVLLTVGRIPDPVHEEIGCEQGDEEGRAEGVVVDCIEVVGQVKSAVAVAEWHTGEVPEDEHEAPFLKIHVP